MSFGKLYTFVGNARSSALLAVIKENKLDVELVETKPAEGNLSADYLLLNRLGRIPTFQGKDGYILTECIAIAIYLTSQNEKTTLLGKTKQDYASILRWMSFFNSEVLPNLGAWFQPLVGRKPYNKKNVEDAKEATNKALKVVEDHLVVNTYLVGERLTLADLFATSIMYRGYGHVLDKKWASANPAITRWYTTIYNQPIYSSVAPKFEIIETALSQPPKQEHKPKHEGKAKEQPKKQEKPKAAAAEEEEEEAPKPKPKHPLEELPRATFVLDEWKRQYSNHETREEALPWFWKNANFEEYSLWKIDYKYNDELTMTFMSSNLVGGFFARLEASRKYIFGSASVYGTTNDSVIQGAFFIRGQEALPAFDVAPDYDSYTFTKLDPKSAKDREFVDDQWAWDKPITINGKEYPHADGKVFK